MNANSVSSVQVDTLFFSSRSFRSQLLLETIAVLRYNEDNLSTEREAMTKTNAVRLVEQAGINFRCTEYAYDENDLNGMHAAHAVGMPPEQVFKTLVARNEKGKLFVFCIPVCCSLDLKKAAKMSGSKKIEMISVKELLPLTGYIRGGCSPIGMKKHYPTWIDETASLYDEIAVSAGVRGQQLILSPIDLVDYAEMMLCDLTE